MAKRATDTPTAEAASPYRVLARKYRPQSFADLVGQEPMVRTLTNAFRTGRIAQAYMLTGVRGVGKTTTARILARALNYSVPGKIDAPTIDMTELGEHDLAIMEGRHVDVIEMDAASHTGIDDIREIIEAVRYKPAIARYKVYIIDEVHMLSKAAFNGLLKTLEEPPEHVKFIFATTEIRKVPVTVLSRCQRFDLRRIEAGRLVNLMRDITAKEEIAIDDAALAMVARAAEGSARDALSLLDQAIAHGSGNVTGDEIRQMLGLADRALVIDLFGEVMGGDVAAALGRLKELYDVGADPAVVLEDLAAFTHLVTRLKLAPSAVEDEALTAEEKTRGAEFASKLSLRTLARAWQMLLKGIEEAKEASRPLAAADMVIVRLAHAADLPTPDEALRALQDGGGNAASQRSNREIAQGSPLGSTSASGGQAGLSPSAAPPRAPLSPTGGRMPRTVNASPVSASPSGSPWPESASPQESPSAFVQIATFEDLVAFVSEKRELRLKNELETNVRLIRFEVGQIEISLTPQALPNLAGDLMKKLEAWTGMRWVVVVARDGGAATIAETRRSAREKIIDDARADPLVSAVFSRFPGAEIVDVRVLGEAAAAPETGNDAPLPDPMEEDD